MRITVDTSHDSHDDIRKVIRMLHHLIGESQEIFTNQPQPVQETSPIANIFGNDSASAEATSSIEKNLESAKETEEISESTEDLFAELFSEEELKKMEPVKEEEEEKPKKKYSVEMY